MRSSVSLAYAFVTMKIPILNRARSIITVGNQNSEIEQTDLHPDPQRSIYVLYTSVCCTFAALEKAREWAHLFGNTITVLVVQDVPYVLPLENPPVPMEFISAHINEISRRFSESIRIRAYLCRDRTATLRRILDLNTPIVIATPKRWWPNSDSRLAKNLHRFGYLAILEETL
jgi:hypothetical protein